MTTAGSSSSQGGGRSTRNPRGKAKNPDARYVQICERCKPGRSCSGSSEGGIEGMTACRQCNDLAKNTGKDIECVFKTTRKMYGDPASFTASPSAGAAPNEETSVAAPETADTASQPSGQSNQVGSNGANTLFPLSSAGGKSTFVIRREVDGVVTITDHPEQAAAERIWQEHGQWHAWEL